MCKTKKIIAGVLCAIVAGIGVIGINAQTAAAQTAASQGATAAAGMSLEQLQQIIEMLKQQIQQIIVLLQQRIAQSPVCGNGICETAKGETAATCAKDCPATGARCTDSDGGVNYYVKGTAVQYSSSGAVSNRETDTCYYNYNPDLFDGSTTSSSSGYWLREAYCNGGILAHKVFECQYGCENGACLRQVITCAKEGESTARGNIVPCCDGLTAVPNSWVDLTTGKCGYNDPAYDICTKCGNGICETAKGENKCNCPADCDAAIADDDKATPAMPGNPNPDEHGCCASCGQGWCEEKQKCLAIWEESCYGCTSKLIGAECVKVGGTYYNGSWQGCFCPLTCSKIGQECKTAAIVTEISEGGHKQCCPGLICSLNKCVHNPNCGNGKCDTGETVGNCPQDCRN